MKNLFYFFLLFSLILSACEDEENPTTSDEDEENTYTYTYKTAEFQIETLKDWEVVDSFTSEYPEDLRVAFRNDVKDSIFTANVTVLGEENTSNDTSYDFAQRKMADHEETLLNYVFQDHETITLESAGAESKTVLSTFEGKNETSGPTLQFMQITLTDAEEAWTVTATYRPSEDEFLIEQMQAMLLSFSLR